MRFTHNALVSTNVEALVVFYERWCGMKLVQDRREEDGSRVAWVGAPERKDFVFVMIEGKDPAKVSPVHRSLGSHYGFALESREAVDRLHNEMQAAGVEVTAPTDYGEVVGYLFIAKDPDGRNVEFSFGQDIGHNN